MSQEIVYTSAPQGLKPNASGFCTVLSAHGMARNLSERLEALSGYRFQFQAHDANAHLNPVNYSHLRMTVGGERFHVLSRICDAGLDHTKRSNKLAHHVAFKAREIAPSLGGSPAWTLSSPGFCETKWEGEPRRVSAGRKKLPDAQRSARLCSAWQAVTGDAGWAGVLAQSALEKPPRPMHVLFPAGTDTLPLVIEASHLLPPEQRWEVTFSTYFTKLEAGTDCQWRFVLDGTPEAHAIRRDPHKPTIDLCAGLGPAPDGPLVEAARTGTVPDWTAPEPPPARRQPLAAPRTASAEKPLISVPAADGLFPEEFPPLTSTAPRLPFIGPERRIPLSRIIAGTVLLFILILAGVIGGFVISQKPWEPPASLALSDATPETPGAPETVELETGLLESFEPKPKSDEPPPLPDPEPAKELAPPAVAMTEEEPPEETPADPVDELPLPLSHVIDVLHEHLPLPPTQQNKGLSGLSQIVRSESAKLATIYVDDPTKVDLKIFGENIILPPGIQFTITESITPDRSARTWEITETNPTGIGPTGNRIGKFRLKDGDLSFEWAQNLKSSKLKYCWLSITAENATGEQTAKCSLAQPIEQDALRLNFAKNVHRIDLAIDPRSLPRAEYLRMEIQVRGIEESRSTPNKATLKVARNEDSSEKAAIDFFDPAEHDPNEAAHRGNDDKLVHIEARIVEGNKAKPVRFVVKNFAYPTVVKPLTSTIPRFPTEIVPPNLKIGRSEKPVEFGRSSEGTAKRDNKDLKGKLRKNLGTIKELIVMRSERLDQVRLANENVKKIPRNRLEQAETLKQTYDEAMDEADRFEERMEHLNEVYDDLEENVEIEFRLYITDDGAETDILRSRSSEPPQERQRPGTLGF